MKIDLKPCEAKIASLPFTRLDTRLNGEVPISLSR